MTNVIEIHGLIFKNDENEVINENTFLDKFLEFMEKEDLSFAGTTCAVKEMSDEKITETILKYSLG